MNAKGMTYVKWMRNGVQSLPYDFSSIWVKFDCCDFWFVNASLTSTRLQYRTQTKLAREFDAKTAELQYAEKVPKDAKTIHYIPEKGNFTFWVENPTGRDFFTMEQIKQNFIIKKENP